jgi:hypothetical protein
MNYKFFIKHIIALVVLSSFVVPNFVSAADFNVRVLDKYTTVEVGNKLYFEVDIKDLDGENIKDVNLDYQIVKDDKIILRNKSIKSISSNTSFTDYVVVPSDLQGGVYVINVKIESENSLIAEVDNTFKVVSMDNSKLKEYFFILIRVIIGVSVLVAINVISNIRKPEQRWT